MGKAKFERTKPHVNVGTIGHVDHGKDDADRPRLRRSRPPRDWADNGRVFANIAKAPEERERGDSTIVTTAVSHVEYEIPRSASLRPRGLPWVTPTT